MSILPDQARCDGPRDVLDNPHHYSNLWPRYDPETWVAEPPTIRTQIWNDMIRARCEEIERDMRRAQREAEWRRERLTSARERLTRVRARWATRKSAKTGAA